MLAFLFSNRQVTHKTSGRFGDNCSFSLFFLGDKFVLGDKVVCMCDIVLEKSPLTKFINSISIKCLPVRVCQHSYRVVCMCDSVRKITSDKVHQLHRQLKQTNELWPCRWRSKYMGIYLIKKISFSVIHLCLFDTKEKMNNPPSLPPSLPFAKKYHLLLSTCVYLIQKKNEYLFLSQNISICVCMCPCVCVCKCMCAQCEKLPPTSFVNSE